jgi:hypothetical protein
VELEDGAGGGVRGEDDDDEEDIWGADWRLMVSG